MFRYLWFSFFILCNIFTMENRVKKLTATEFALLQTIQHKESLSKDLIKETKNLLSKSQYSKDDLCLSHLKLLNRALFELKSKWDDKFEKQGLGLARTLIRAGASPDYEMSNSEIFELGKSSKYRMCEMIVPITVWGRAPAML